MTHFDKHSFFATRIQYSRFPQLYVALEVRHQTSNTCRVSSPAREPYLCCPNNFISARQASNLHIGGGLDCL